MVERNQGSQLSSKSLPFFLFITIFSIHTFVLVSVIQVWDVYLTDSRFYVSGIDDFNFFTEYGSGWQPDVVLFVTRIVTKDQP